MFNDNKNDKDTKESRCSGLINGYALRLPDYKEISVIQALKEDNFICSKCLSKAIIKRCTDKIDHFAHKARLSPVLNGENESKLHNQCKNEICNFLKNNFPSGNWEIERPIKENKHKKLKEIIPDISGRINNIPIGIEVQKTPYTVNKIANKTIEYAKRNMCVLWVVPLKESLGEEAFRPRLYEKYLHSLYFGKTYYYVVGKNNIIPVHYSPAKRYIDEATWWEGEGIDANEVSVGGYDLTYKTIKTPNYGNLLDLSKDFIPYKRKYFKCKNEKKDIPECYILKDQLDRWWNTNEFNDTDNQKEIIKKSKIQFSIEFEDDYNNY
jgi:hypothetical protein